MRPYNQILIPVIAYFVIRAEIGHFWAITNIVAIVIICQLIEVFLAIKKEQKKNRNRI